MSSCNCRAHSYQFFSLLFLFLSRVFSSVFFNMYPEGKSVANHLLWSLSRPCLFHPLFPRKEALYAIFSIFPQPLLTLMDQCQRLLTRVSCHNLYHEPKSQGLFSFYHLAYSQGKYSRQGKGNSMSRCGSPPPLPQYKINARTRILQDKILKLLFLCKTMIILIMLLCLCS